MNCQTAQKQISGYLDGVLDRELTTEIGGHLSHCPACNHQRAEYTAQRSALRSARPLAVPANLSTSLLVLASKERARQLNRVDWRARAANLRDHASLLVTNLMRPFALPFAGGLTSAMLLFGVLAPSFSRPAYSSHDVPTGWYTEASVMALGPFPIVEDVLILDVKIDQQGRMVDYSIPDQGATAIQLQENETFRRSVENNLLFTQFTPANFFGQPISGKVRIKLRRSQMDVKG